LYLAGDRPTYWRSRFSDAAIDHFGLGFDYESGCPTYPLRNEDGALIGLVRRRLEPDGPKYVYPQHIKISELLFGWEKWNDDFDGPVVLVEGAMDVVALWEAGVPALGIYGSRFSERQGKMVRSLYPKYVVCAFDMDAAGDQATKRVYDLVGDYVTVYRASWDPDEAKDVAELSEARRRQVIEEATLFLDS
jgi:DNA primase